MFGFGAQNSRKGNIPAAAIPLSGHNGADTKMWKEAGGWKQTSANMAKYCCWGNLLKTSS